MLYLEEPSWDTPEYDVCGNGPVMAVLKVENIVIPLCSECLENLRENLAEYDANVHCYQCKQFVRSPSGLHYGGSCKLLAKEKGIQITRNNAGYECCKGYSDYCDKGEKETE